MPKPGPRALQAVHGEPETWTFLPSQPLAWDRHEAVRTASPRSSLGTRPFALSHRTPRPLSVLCVNLCGHPISLPEKVPLAKPSVVGRHNTPQVIAQ